MYDNVPPHSARFTVEFLDEVKIKRSEWLACSVDLNPIGHVWDVLGR